jgi:hypothetical protein
MDFQVIDEDRIEIRPGRFSMGKVLEAMARLSYETAETATPFFTQPFDIPSDKVDFADLLNPDGFHLDYLNGRRCSTSVQREGDLFILDASWFRSERGSPMAFLRMVQAVLNNKA